ncbi:MAG TPA: formate dehydrogenase accessory protein FdhE [Burkholderiales bacterium]|nr:formate dehydrogenase accessory protein FdhE [Burkholderiales bacterium]
MIRTCESIDELKRERPDWTPWLAPVERAIEEMENGAWDAVRARWCPQTGRAPLLTNAVLELDQGLARRVLAFDSAFETLDLLAVLQASLNRDEIRLADHAHAARSDPDAFAALAALAAKPLLHACRRLGAWRAEETWSHGYCGVCGGWPAFAEVRGVERNRYFRCGDCGDEWQASCLACPFCGSTDHEHLGSLVTNDSGAGICVEVCNGCRGYLKVFTTLRGARAAHVLLHDLATSELDIAAVERGYRRPAVAGHPLDLKLQAAAAGPLAA